MLEGVILLIGLLIIFAFFFPAIFKGVQSFKAKGTKVSPQASSQPSPSASPETSDQSPLCSDVITIPAAEGQAPFKVTFLATAKPIASPILGFQWDFDNDGVWDTAIVTQPQDHTFQSVGTYLVKILVWDEAKNSRVCETTVNVKP